MREVSLITRLLLVAAKEGPMLKWSSRKRNNSFFEHMKASVKRLLKILSGNDMGSMLRDLLTLKEREKFQSTKIADALRNIGAEVQKRTPKRRHPFIRSLKDAGISRLGAFKAGFRPSGSLW